MQAAESPVVSDVPVQMGGKKRQNKKNNKGGAYGVENVLAPAVLYGLRRLATPGGKRNKQSGGKVAFSSQAAPVEESTGPLLAVVPVVPPAGVAVVPPSVEQVAPVDKPQEAVAVATDSGDQSLQGGAKKSKKGKKGPMAEGRVGVYGKVKAWGGDDKNDKNDDDNKQDGGKKKRNNKRKGGDKKDDDKKNNDNQNDNNQDGGKKKNNKRKGGDKKDDDKKNNDNQNDNNQDGGKKKSKRTKKVKGGALDLYAQQLEQISNSLNKLLFN